MSQNSSIEWTDATWNRSGLHENQSGCKHCYARDVRRAFQRCEGPPL